MVEEEVVAEDVGDVGVALLHAPVVGFLSCVFRFTSDWPGVFTYCPSRIVWSLSTSEGIEICFINIMFLSLQYYQNLPFCFTDF